MDLLIWFESVSLFTWVRESPSMWAYPTVLFVHTFGMSVLVGTSAAVDIRLLGMASSIPVRQMSRFYRLMWIGLLFSGLSGTLLTLADATTKVTSPVLQIKLVLIAAALVIAVLIQKQVFGNPGFSDRFIPADIKVIAALSLIFWAGATGAGRLIAYVGPVSGFF